MASAALTAWWFAAGPAQPADPCGGAAPLAIGRMAQVTPGDVLGDRLPALSPDGKLLAYAAGNARRMRVFIRPVAGGRAIPLSEGADAFEFQPRWSPDGNRLDLTPDEVRVAPSLGGASRRIAGGGVSAAAWAPDDARVLVIRRDALSVAPLEGGPERALGNAPQEPYQCDWTREGDRIACAFGNRIGVAPGQSFGNIAPSGIVIGRATGGPFVELVARRELNQSPAWSPDGRRCTSCRAARACATSMRLASRPTGGPAASRAG